MFYAEIYKGSRRFTGRISDEPLPGFVQVDMPESEFWDQYDYDEHDACHDGNEPDCPWCKGE